MSGIAEVLINLGYEVTGSDRRESNVTDHMQKIGAKVFFDHQSENVSSAHVVVVSTAVKSDNIEMVSAREQMIPVIPRAEMLAELMRMKYGVAIAGTHGKTTTTSLIATVLAAGQLDPTVVNGGRIKSIGSHAKLGQSEFLVAEADESDGSFLQLSPALAVVTTLDEEHLDHYKTFDNMKEAFLTFMNRIPFYGASIICSDEPSLQSMIPQLEKRYITYGLNSQADYNARNISVQGMRTKFEVIFRGKRLGQVVSPLPGQHNVCNTLAAIAVGMELDLDFETIKDSLQSFTGVQRRFEVLNQRNEYILVDDYGHHPAEIQATLKTAKEVWPDRKLIVIFQPHRYSRTLHLMKQFWSAFNDADHLILMPIYPAGEEPLEGASTTLMEQGIKDCGHKNVEYLETRKDILFRLQQILKRGDVIMTLGAGDIGELNRELIPHLHPNLPDKNEGPKL